MSYTPISNAVYTLHLDPTPQQMDDLRRLHLMATAVRLACWQQRQLRQSAGLDIPVVTLLGGAVLEEHMCDDEVTALLASPLLTGAPLGLVEDALQVARHGLERERRTGETYRPGLYAGVLYAGRNLLLDITGDGVWLAGVEGMVPAHIAWLPRWAQAVIRGEALMGPAGSVDLRGAQVTGRITVEGYHHDRAVWTLDLELHWPAYADRPALLAPLFEPVDELSPERRKMVWVMGWDRLPDEQRSGGKT